MQEVLKKTFDVEKIRQDFPILQREVNGKPLVYLDNGATAQKPTLMIERIQQYYEQENANIHRGVHTLSQNATSAYEEVRLKMQAYLNAQHSEEILFTSGTTAGVNLVAQSYGQANLKEGDEVLISAMEHHSNIVPWQMICEQKGAHLKVIPINDQGEIIYEEFLQLLTEKTKILSIVHISNTLGTINPIKRMIEAAHEKNIPVLVDGAQAVPHMRIDMQALDADFYVFSMHKMFGPTGVGILYGKKELLDAMPPYQGGGDMIKTVTFEKTTYNELPHKFEAGTPNIADGIASGAVLDYLNSLNWDEIAEYEAELLKYATEKLSAIEGLKIIGQAEKKASVISFIIEDIHSYDLGVLIDKMGIAVRTGHHCTQPLMERFGILGTVRASFTFYNTNEEVDKLVEAIQKARRMLL